MTATAIEWADRVWNPVTGCTKVSQGCKHCYAEVMAKRTFGRLYPHIPDAPLPDNVQQAMAEEFGESIGHELSEAGGMRARRFTDVQTHADRLDAPLRWRKPSRIFVNSMSDLFHEDVPDDFIAAVFGIMASSPQHTFLILTKRPERARSWFAMLADAAAMVTDGDGEVRWCVKHLDQHITRSFHCVLPVWPLPNVWLGVSVEDQATADQRIPILLQTPAAVRWVSYEPALAGVDFTDIVVGRGSGSEHHINALSMEGDNVADDEEYSGACIDWVVVGGESGPKARPCRVEWVRAVVDQCRDAGVPVFTKQLGANVQWGRVGPCGFPDTVRFTAHGGGGNTGYDVITLRDRKGGDPSEWPEDLRVREFPKKAVA